MCIRDRQYPVLPLEGTYLVWIDCRASGISSGIVAFIVFFKDKKSTAESTHTGLVEYAKGGVLHTIEGNTSNAVKRRQYDLNDTYIVGAFCGGFLILEEDDRCV